MLPNEWVIEDYTYGPWSHRSGKVGALVLRDGRPVVTLTLNELRNYHAAVGRFLAQKAVGGAS